MAYIQGEGRTQGSLFPVVLDDLIPVDHMCRVIDAFVASLALSERGFERAQAAETGRPAMIHAIAEALFVRLPKSDSFITALGS
jgi:transposase